MAEILVPGQSGIPLDLYVKAGTTLYDPSSITFQVTDANAAFQGSGTGYKLSIGHYDARNFIVTTSGALGTWTITWNVGGTTKTEQFTVQAPSLTEVGDVQNDIERMREQIRFDIGDLTQSIFNDTQLNIYLIKAVQRVNRALGISVKVRPTGITPGGLGTPAITPPISINILAGTIFPDTDEMKDIVVLQTEVLITRSEMSALRRASAGSATAAGAELIGATSGIVTDTGAGLRVRNADGVEIDTTTRMSQWLSNRVKLFLDEAKARELELEKALLQLRHDISGNSTKVVF